MIPPVIVAATTATTIPLVAQTVVQAVSGDTDDYCAPKELHLALNFVILGFNVLPFEQ